MTDLYRICGWSAWGSVCLFAWALTGCSAGTDQAMAEGRDAATPPSVPPALVETRQVATAGTGEALWVTGTLLSRHDTRIAAEVAGRLVAVVEIGDRLAVGDAVARVDDGALRIQLRSDTAEIKRHETRVGFLDKQARRVETLTDQQITARHQLDDLSAQKAMAQQDLERARIQRERTRFLLDRSVLRAPFAGRVVERLAEPGAYVTEGEDVARLVDVDRVEVRARAPLSVAPAVREGLEVEVKGPAWSGVGRIRAAVPVGDERSLMFEVRIEIDGAPWAVGSPVQVALPQAAEQQAEGAVAVPRDALILRRGATYVFAVADDGTARRVEVSTGAGQGDSIAVTGDLRPGDRVVVRGGERLQPGQPVEVVNGSSRP